MTEWAELSATFRIFGKGGHLLGEIWMVVGDVRWPTLAAFSTTSSSTVSVGGVPNFSLVLGTRSQVGENTVSTGLGLCTPFNLAP